jgi:ABC-type nickel/cobalt efflux system permease component RcnA
MEVAVVLLLLVIVAAYFLFFRQPRKEQQSEPLSTRKPYAAVRVKPHEHACNAAFEMSHRTFLVAEAPILPLQDCNKSDSCRCGYRHYDDRRQGLERRGESFVMRDAYTKKERRDDEKHGRRQGDD